MTYGTYGYSHFIHFKTVAQMWNTVFKYMNNVPQLEEPFSLLNKGVSQYFCPYNGMYKSLVFGDEFLSQGLHLKSHQKCSAGLGLD